MHVPKTDYPIPTYLPYRTWITSNTTSRIIKNPNLLTYFHPSGEVPSYNYSLNLMIPYSFCFLFSGKEGALSTFSFTTFTSFYSLSITDNNRMHYPINYCILHCSRNKQYSENMQEKLEKVCQKRDSNPRPQKWTATWTQRLRPLGHPDITKKFKTWKDFLET